MESFSKETDGFFARHFDRRISGAISRCLLQTPVTPNQITVFVTLLGIIAGFFMAQPGYNPKVGGAFLFLSNLHSGWLRWGSGSRQTYDLRIRRLAGFVGR